MLEEKCDIVYAKNFEQEHLISLAKEVDAVIIRANGVVSEAVIEVVSNSESVRSTLWALPSCWPKKYVLRISSSVTGTEMPGMN